MTTDLATRSVRVMVVDDSLVARSVNVRWLKEQPDFEVVAACRSGREAVDRIRAARPDVIVLDVEMPDMTGVEALPLLLGAMPDVAVLMASSHTTEGAAVTMKCLALGAADVLPKPSRECSDEYRRELVAKVRGLRQVRERRRLMGPLARGAGGVRPQPAARGRARKPRVGALVIAASTGGPHALHRLLEAAAPTIRDVPTMIVQHMPAGFTGALARHLSESSGLDVREAADGEQVVAGSVYVAPGGRHFSVQPAGAKIVAKLDDGPPVNFCKPSVDPLFRSAAEAYGAGLVAVVLTGMGSDGASAVPVIAAAGGRVIAQDEATSVVWGMPGAAVATGACASVLPLDEIGPAITRLARGERS